MKKFLARKYRVYLVHVKIGSLVEIETMWRFDVMKKIESLKKNFGTKLGHNTIRKRACNNQ